MGGLDKDFFCVHNASFCDIGDGFAKYRRKHRAEDRRVVQYRNFFGCIGVV
jgi:hypothetical protein